MAAVSVVMAIFVSVSLVAAGVFVGSANRAYAHTFEVGESAEFLTMVQVIEVETALAAENAAEQEMASEHIEHASEQLTDHILEEISERNERIARDLPLSLEELGSSISAGASAEELNQQVGELRNLLGEAVQVRIEREQLNNSTIHAVVVANLVDEALEHYGEAVGFEGNMTDMSSMNMTGTGIEGMESMDHTTIVSEVHYQSSLAFAQRAQEKYTEISGDAIEGMDEAVGRLDLAFPNFVSAIENMSPAMDVMNVAHVEIHPNLMVAYDLQIIPEFPLPLLLLIPAMAGAVLYGRFRGF